MNCTKLARDAIFGSIALCLLLLVLFTENLGAQSKIAATIVDTPEATIFSGKTMGPIKFRVTLAKTSGQILMTPEAGHDLAEDIDARLENVNQMMSTYIEDSEVSRFNRHDNNDWFSVSSDTALVVSRSIEINKQTSGAFDITVGPLVNLWNFGPGKGQNRVPEQSEIDTVLEFTGTEKVRVRMDPPAISKTDVRVQIDLSAIAKGFAVDQVAKTLKSKGYKDFLIEVGGEVATSGKKKNGQSWMVGILQPSPLINTPRKRVPLDGKAMATSGDYQNFFQIGDETYSHTIDPKTGWPVKHSLTSVSIIADDCLTADAIATAVNVMGVEQGKQFSDANSFAYFLIARNSRGSLDEFASSSFPTQADSTSEPGFSGIFIGTLAVFLMVVVAMAIGVICGRKRIQGSCGGIASLQSDSVSTDCSMCSQPSDECSELREAVRKKAEAESASE